MRKSHEVLTGDSSASSQNKNSAESFCARPGIGHLVVPLPCSSFFLCGQVPADRGECSQRCFSPLRDLPTDFIAPEPASEVPLRTPHRTHRTSTSPDPVRQTVALRSPKTEWSRSLLPAKWSKLSRRVGRHQAHYSLSPGSLFRHSGPWSRAPAPMQRQLRSAAPRCRI